MRYHQMQRLSIFIKKPRIEIEASHHLTDLRISIAHFESFRLTRFCTFPILNEVMVTAKRKLQGFGNHFYYSQILDRTPAARNTVNHIPWKTSKETKACKDFVPEENRTFPVE
jgi:hypothetical protein